MLFHNPIFLLLFLPIIFLFYFFILKGKSLSKIYLLIIGSFIFYAAWNINLSPLIIVTILTNYFFGKKISETLEANKKKIILSFAIIFNILFLAFFKYSDFLITNINSEFSTILSSSLVVF